MYRHEEKNYYDLLGISRDASTREIKAVYRDLARRYHPDLQQCGETHGCLASPAGDSGWFKRLTAAYHTLSDPCRRSIYDAELRCAASGEDSPWLGSQAGGRKVRRRARAGITGTLRGLIAPLRRW